MDFETWLYLFFIVISIIVPIVKKANKKKQDIEETNEPDVIQEDIFEALKEQFNRQAKPLRSEPEYIEESKDDFLNYDDEAVEKTYLDAINKAENETVFTYDNAHFEQDENDAIHDIDIASDDNSDEERPSRAFHFDPVDAVIYSEILKRPEF